MLSHVRKLKNPFSALKNEKKNQSYQTHKSATLRGKLGRDCAFI